MMQKIEIDTENTYENSGKKKMPSMPLTTQHTLKGHHSRLSSELEALTLASSVATDRYNVEV